MMVCCGLDLSLDHAGYVVLNDKGDVQDYGALTSVKRYKDIFPNHIMLLSKQEKEESKETFRLRRMKEFRSKLIWTCSQPLGYFSIEGFAYASQSTSICQIAELTGYIKQAIFEGGGYIRIHDPLSVKLFATNEGNCLKKDVVNEALKHFDIPEGLIKKKIVKKKGEKVEEYNGPGTDIADAYFLARMLWMELEVRAGRILLSDLSEGQRRIFLRTSKHYPENLLSRSFIHKGE
jgi:Holliday junction resolvasome RuvABC endonuclease subunit